MFRIVLLALSVLTVTLSFAQINGTVKDVETKEGIGYASVYWKADKSGVLTNEDGDFSIHEPKRKDDILMISYVGYKPMETSANKLPKNETYLLRMSNEIESVIVTNLSAEEIMAKASKNRRKNHFKAKTFQAGYIESLFYDNNKLFQISQSSYNVGDQFGKKDKAKREVYVNKVRSVVDSALFKSINDELNFKKMDTTFGPQGFISMGQSMSFSGDKDDKRITRQYELVDEIDYLDEIVYVIHENVFYKGELMATSKNYIEKESFAYLYQEVATNPTFDLNQTIRGVGKTLIKLMGFEYDLKSAKIAVYYKRNANNPEVFDLEKGLSRLEVDVKRTDRWIKGKVVQEFYLRPRRALTQPLKQSYDEQTLVADFTDDTFFEGKFHLPTSASTQRKIEKVKANNATYTGGITSERYEEWNKKQEKKKAKKEARKKRKGKE